MTDNTTAAVQITLSGIGALGAGFAGKIVTLFGKVSMADAPEDVTAVLAGTGNLCDALIIIGLIAIPVGVIMLLYPFFKEVCDSIASWLFNLLHPTMIADGKVWHRMGAFSDKDEADDWAHELWKLGPAIRVTGPDDRGRYQVWYSIGQVQEAG